MGKDFGFGYKRSGTAEMLKEMGPSLGFETEIIEKAEENGREISSTWAREELEQGNMEAVSGLLGYDYAVHGEIVHGHALGRTIGVPTINQIPPAEKAASAVRRLRFRGENRRKNLLRYHKHRC